jgi:hypothetical protein
MASKLSFDAKFLIGHDGEAEPHLCAAVEALFFRNSLSYCTTYE